MTNLEQLRGKSRTVDIVIDESCHWDEDQEMSLLSLASTSGLCAMVFHTAYELIQPFLTEEEISVVIEANIRHITPVHLSERLAIGVKVIDVVGNKIKLRGVVMKGETKILEAEFVRAVISRNYLRRISIEKTT
ncbi:MAG TPA: thioesterase [Pseudothermotoga sp.]|nr:thioesterase [Pseudothermotoga sp.]HOK83566.1 thioesterase [Pseudothermotoga sp.]HPP69639.1 thioesterase [Pseudothermotoga sp.]